jgi:DNA-binding GntR family transcriptional regulator
MPPTVRTAESSSPELVLDQQDEPAERANQVELAYSRLKQLMLDGTLPAGTQLLMDEVAARLSVSRTPVREAMVRLQQEGMLEIRPRHGMRVLAVSARDMAEIYEILTALEGTAAEIVARRRPTADELSPLHRSVTDMKQALASDDLTGWAKADEAFHSYLVQLTNNKRLVQMVGQLWKQAHRARMVTLKLRPKPTKSVRDHAALVKAIARGDAAAARQIHEDHRRRAGAAMVALLESLGPSQL